MPIYTRRRNAAGTVIRMVLTATADRMHTSPPAVQRSRSRERVGTCLKKRIANFTKISGDGCAKCTSLASQMDAWGIEECERKREYIVSRLMERRDLIADAMTKHPTAHAAVGWVLNTSLVEPILRKGATWLLDAAIEDAKQLASVPATTQKERKSRLSVNRISRSRSATVVQQKAIEGTPLEPLPFDPSRPIVRHLAYHCMPWAGKGSWQANLDQLLKRIHLFNGRRRMAIVTSPECDPPAMVQAFLAGHNFEFIVTPNNPGRREVQTFLDLMSPLSSTDHNETIFYAHAKGVRHAPVTDTSTTVHRWAQVQYAVCLDDWETVQRLLVNHAFAGAFKRYGQFRTKENHRWHYSGTFFWIRSARVFNRPWQKLDQRFFGVESWPGMMSPASHGACVFGDHAGDLYKPEYWNQVVSADFARWQMDLQERQAGQVEE